MTSKWGGLPIYYKPFQLSDYEFFRVIEVESSYFGIIIFLFMSNNNQVLVNEAMQQLVQNSKWGGYQSTAYISQKIMKFLKDLTPEDQ